MYGIDRVIAMIVDIWSYPLIIGEPLITPPVKRPKQGIKLSLIIRVPTLS